MTAYEMRISDWSSDVCSSDLHQSAPRAPQCPKDKARTLCAEQLDRETALSSAWRYPFAISDGRNSRMERALVKRPHPLRCGTGCGAAQPSCRTHDGHNALGPAAAHRAPGFSRSSRKDRKSTSELQSL